VTKTIARVATALLAAAVVVPGVARAQSDEIQVYDGGLARTGVFNLTWHNNFTPDGARTPEFPGAITSNKSWNGVPEWAYGVNNWFEAGLYMPLYSRMGPYDVDLLRRAAEGKPRRVVEYWAHVAAFMPVDLWPVMQHRMRKYRERGHEWMGLPHSPELRITERLTLTTPDVLQDQIMLDDPVVLDKPVTYTLAYRRLPKYEMVEFVCDNNREFIDEKGGTHMRVRER